MWQMMTSVPTEKGEAMKDCNSCAEKCPQAELAHQAALGRTYATNELVAILKKVESGELAPVVRCKDCKKAKKHEIFPHSRRCSVEDCRFSHKETHFCSYGERRSDD